MSNGEKFTTSFLGNYGYFLLEDQSASDNGKWIDASNILSASIEYSTLESGGSIAIHVSNAEEKPADGDSGFVILTITPASPAWQLLAGFPCGWVKAKKTAGGLPAATDIILRAKSQ